MSSSLGSTVPSRRSGEDVMLGSPAWSWDPVAHSIETCSALRLRKANRSGMHGGVPGWRQRVGPRKKPQNGQSAEKTGTEIRA
jgi:hypothetical protein